MIEVEARETLPQFVYGSFSQRFFAYVIDILLINAVSSLFFTIARSFGLYDRSGSFSLYKIIGLLIYLAYFTLMTKWTEGQTIGKMIFGLRVLSLHNEELTWGDVFTREFIGRYIQKTIKILYLLVFVTKRRETMADLFTDTVVVSEQSYLDLREFINTK